ncbi:MAG: hypothetical protein FWB99_05545 [Treponema sp.]|nr:hypothetical protein [Treponema sp.]
MGFFTAGNLLTLGIALLIFVLFRYIDKNNRHKRGLKEYSDSLKKEIGAFMEEQEKAVKDYGIALKVERDSARELMKRLLLSEEELAAKAETIAHIDSQIKSYENSLKELDRMTSRVQENMNRIREESAFVETTGKRLNEAKTRIDGITKELGSLESNFERKNTQALERAVDSMLVGAKSSVSDLSAALETIERQVDEHRQEITKIEDKRATDMARDLEHINNILKTAVEQAGERASKIEEAALANLKEQAEERLRRLKTAEEDRLRGYQESAKARIAEVQSLLKTFQEQWEAERAAWETKDGELRELRAKDIQELAALLEDSGKRQNALLAEAESRLAISLEESDKRLAASLEDSKSRLAASLEESGNRLAASLEGSESRLAASLEESDNRLAATKAAFEAQMRELAELAARTAASQKALLFKAAAEMRQETLETTRAALEEYSGKWQNERTAWEAKDRELRELRDKDIQELNTLFEDSGRRQDASLAESENRLAASLEDSESRLAASLEDSKSRMAALLKESESRLASSLEESDKRLADTKAAFETQMSELAELAAQTAVSQKALLFKAAAEIRQETLETTGAALEEYSGKWQSERSGWENKDRELREQRTKDIQDFNTSIEDSQQRLAAAKAAFEAQMREFSEKTNQTIASQEAQLAKAAEDMKHAALEITEKKLEEYRIAQDAEFRRLETLTDDTMRLDSELRHNMQIVTNRIQEDFSRYEQESAGVRRVEFDKFATSATALRKQMGEIEKELSALKSAAYDNVSEKLKGFEDDFFADLSRRSGDIDQRLIEWQDGLETRLARMGEEAEAGRRDLERGLAEDMRKQLATQDERLLASLERLKAETSAFEERIRGEVKAADESVVSLKEQLSGSLEEARKEADLFIKVEIGKHSLASSETLKQQQRELEAKLGEMSAYIQTRSTEISQLIDASRSDLAEAKDGIAGKVRELDDSIEDARRRVRDLSAETDTRIAAVRSSVEDTERHIKEAVDQTKIVDKAEALRLDLARRIEDLKGDMEHLDQRRAEVLQLENEFVKIKRLEDDVNAKMTRFLTEKRKIETMEADFNRLLKISGAVEEKLGQVTASHDTLQGMELQLRKLHEALGTTEEKFQRIEKKSQLLDNTNDGIDRNFRVLQEAEKLSTRIGGELGRYTEDLSSIRNSIEKLSGESEKARQAIDRIDVLDSHLAEIEERIEYVQKSKQWLAEAETRLEDLNRKAHTQAQLIDTMLKDKGKGKKLPSLDEPGERSTLTLQEKKENVLALARQGWSVEAIAKALKISIGEVQLILQMTHRD